VSDSVLVEVNYQSINQLLTLLRQKAEHTNFVPAVQIINFEKFKRDKRLGEPILKCHISSFYDRNCRSRRLRKFSS